MHCAFAAVWLTPQQLLLAVVRVAWVGSARWWKASSSHETGPVDAEILLRPRSQVSFERPWSAQGPPHTFGGTAEDAVEFSRVLPNEDKELADTVLQIFDLRTSAASRSVAVAFVKRYRKPSPRPP
eukprot:805424-Amphidinium_carterae.1